MRKLPRSEHPAPACLDAYKHGRDEWNKNTPAPECKDQIRAALCDMQANRCAYCECQLISDRKHGSQMHIEHFHQRHRYPQQTFAWENLFASCSHAQRCGKHKDRPQTNYAPDDLLKPDKDDAEGFLEFLPNGLVEAKNGLSVAAVRRANETIRVFNLNHPKLQESRRSAIANLQHHKCAKDLATATESEIADFLALIHNHPFATALKHAVLGNE